MSPVVKTTSHAALRRLRLAQASNSRRREARVTSLRRSESGDGRPFAALD